MIWDDRGSGADTDISVYDIGNTTTSLSMGLFYAKTDYDHYNTIQSTRVYALKQSNVANSNVANNNNFIQLTDGTIGCPGVPVRNHAAVVPDQDTENVTGLLKTVLEA